VSITDPVGDLTPSPGDPPPKWADLAGARLRRTAKGWELRVRLGTTAPDRTDSDHTMNVASFYDTDGDGQIEYGVWANLASNGWGGAYFDQGPDRGPNRFGDDADIDITTDGRDVVLRFPASHLRGATRFRWSIASEWGRYAVISTTGAARDDAPDDDASVDFP